MKKSVIWFLLLVVIPTTIAQEDWFYTAESLDIALQISTEAAIVPTKSSYVLNYLEMNLSFFPFDTETQKVTYTASPEPKEIKDNMVTFRWDNPKETAEMDITTTIKIFNTFQKVNKKIPFPLTEVEQDLLHFTQSTKTIDAHDKEIIQLASSLAEGHDDLYEVVHQLASWTKNNIDYNLSTLTADVSQNASWVLRKRQGVCDELTNLFIALNRALGIPAKFVSGIAYTESELFPESWGPHGWAEVYFPGFGWIPWDVTYGQFGFVDPTHIKMKEALDATEPSSTYLWYGNNVNIEAEKLDFKTIVTKKNGRIPNSLKITSNIFKDEVISGSYNLLEVKVENLLDSYQSAELLLAKSKEVTIINEKTKDLLLKPKEKKTIFWILEVTDDLDADYVYTLPLGVYTQKAPTVETDFKVKTKTTLVDLSTITSLVEAKTQEAEKVYSKNVALACEADTSTINQYNILNARCSIKNIGNVFLEDLQICHEATCKQLDLGIAQQKDLLFPLVTEKPGNIIYTFTAKNKEISKAANLELLILDEPSISITDIAAPRLVWFDETYNVSFTLARNSVAVPKNIKMQLNGNDFYLQELNETHNYLITLPAVELASIVNNQTILVSYQDDENNHYLTTASFTITLNELTFLQKGRLFTNKIAAIARAAGNQMLALFSVTVLVFIIIAGIILHHSVKYRKVK